MKKSGFADNQIIANDHPPVGRFTKLFPKTPLKYDHIAVIATPLLSAEYRVAA